MVDPSRLVVASAQQVQAWFPEFHWRETCEFETDGQPVLITDPIYLAVVYDSGAPESSFLREHAVILTEFGGDASGPVWWRAPYLVLPLSCHYDEDGPVPEQGVEVLAEEVGCDSASFLFLPVGSDLPVLLRKEIISVVNDHNGALVKVPAGHYTFYYEQFDPPAPDWANQYRNIVAGVRS